MEHFNQLLQIMTHPSTTGGFLSLNALFVILGMVLPFLIGMVLPRKNTIKYGGFIYRWLGKLLLQKRIHTPATDLIGALLTIVRSTFVDLSFGIYMESRTDLTPEAREKKIQEYLTVTTMGAPKDSPKP